jgi:predicted dehydrogenase
MRVLGTRAAYAKQDADVQEAALRSSRHADAPGFGEDPEERWGRVGAGADVRPVKTEKGDYARFYAQTADWLRGGAPPPVDPADAIAVLDLIEAAQRSAAEATVVRFPQGC